jgi:hypothetical protein
MTALFRKIDCHSIAVADLHAALAFYRDGLSHDVSHGGYNWTSVSRPLARTRRWTSSGPTKGALVHVHDQDVSLTQIATL